jgi:hypothetical protein
MITFNPDKFGYYQVGERTSYSKFEAVEWSKIYGDKVLWNFNNEVFNAIDWTKEPETDLWEMYKQRARQIRDAYDYVVLWYSGGSDSHNLLLAWIDAGLKIDEIATTWNYEATGDYQNHYNAEITNVVLPDIKKLQESFEFKFRIVDISQFCIDIIDTWKTEFEYNVNFHMSPNNPARSLFREKIDDYKNLIEQGKKLCFVWGKEKPMIRYSRKHDKHYVEFCDNVDNCVTPYVQRNYFKGWYDEFFYWTPDYPLIPVKQAHAILNFVKLSDSRKYFNTIRSFNGYSKKFDAYLNDDAVKSIIYPKWSNSIFCNGKASSFVYSLRDEWFLNSNLNYKDRFLDIAESYFSTVDPDDRERKYLSPIKTGVYFIE